VSGTSTYWSGGGTGAWIRMDLGGLRSLATVDLAVKSLESYDVPNLAVRYVRIVGRGASTDDDLSLSEIKVKGY
jgi:hypothetical protein